MKRTLKMRPRTDEIGGMIDDVLADPSRAEELKRILRSRLRAVERTAEEATDDPDLWENVPV